MMATDGSTANPQPVNGVPDGTNQRTRSARHRRGAALARTVAVSLAAAAVLAGCSSQQVYRSLQDMEQSRCTDWPAHLYRECLEASDTSWREYEAARQQAEDESD